MLAFPLKLLVPNDVLVELILKIGSAGGDPEPVQAAVTTISAEKLALVYPGYPAPMVELLVLGPELMRTVWEGEVGDEIVLVPSYR